MSYAGPSTSGRSTLFRVRTSGPARPAPGGVGPRVAGLPPADSGRQTALVIAAGVMLGLAVGAGAGLLLAPQAGEDTRRSLSRRGRRLTRRGRDAWDDLRDELRRARRALRRRRASKAKSD